MQQQNSSGADFYTRKQKRSLSVANACGSMEKLGLLEPSGNHPTTRMSSAASNLEAYIDSDKSKSSELLLFGDKDKTYQSVNIENFNNVKNGVSRKLSVASSGDSLYGPSRERSTVSQQHRKHCHGDEIIKEDSHGNDTDLKPPRKSSVTKGKPVCTSSVQRQNYQFGVNLRNNPKFVQRYGGFHLVFPFNDVTQKCAVASTLDLKTVVGECQRALQQSVQSRGKKSFTPLWLPLKQTEDTSIETA